jgi:hypothetical protein
MYEKYERMKADGSNANEVAAAATEDGLDAATTWKMLATVFDLSFVDAKEVWIQAKGIANSLAECQEPLSPELDVILNELDQDSK